VLDNNKLLYEENEILDILNGKKVEGASNKLTAISAEIDKISEELSERQSRVETTSIDYITCYNNAMKAIDEYNQLVY